MLDDYSLGVHIYKLSKNVNTLSTEEGGEDGDYYTKEEIDNKLNDLDNKYIQKSNNVNIDPSTGNISTTGEITAGGNISTTGDIYADNVYASNKLTCDNLTIKDVLINKISIEGDSLTGDDVIPTVNRVIEIASGGSIDLKDYIKKNEVNDGNIITTENIQGKNITASNTIQGKDLEISNTIQTKDLTASNVIQTNDLIVSNNITTSNTIQTKDLTASNVIQTNNLNASGDIQGNNLTITNLIQTKDLNASNNIIASNTIQGKDLEISNTIQTKDLTASNVIQTKDLNVSNNITTSNTIQGKDLEISNTIQTKDLTASNVIQTKDLNVSNNITTTNTIQGKDIEASNIIQTKDLNASNTIQGKDIEASNTIQTKDLNASNNITSTSLSITTGTITTTPNNDNDIVNKKYVDDIISPITNDINEIKNKLNITGDIYYVKDIVNTTEGQTDDFILVRSNDTLTLYKKNNNTYEIYDVNNGSLCIVNDLETIYIKYNGNQNWKEFNTTPQPTTEKYNYFVNQIYNEKPQEAPYPEYILYNNDVLELQKYNDTIQDKYEKISILQGALCVVNDNHSLYINYGTGLSQNWIKLNNEPPQQQEYHYNINTLSLNEPTENKPEYILIKNNDNYIFKKLVNNEYINFNEPPYGTIININDTNDIYIKYKNLNNLNDEQHWIKESKNHYYVLDILETEPTENKPEYIFIKNQETNNYTLKHLNNNVYIPLSSININSNCLIINTLETFTLISNSPNQIWEKINNFDTSKTLHLTNEKSLITDGDIEIKKGIKNKIVDEDYYISTEKINTSNSTVNFSYTTNSFDIVKYNNMYYISNDYYYKTSFGYPRMNFYLHKTDIKNKLEDNKLEINAYNPILYDETYTIGNSIFLNINGNKLFNIDNLLFICSQNPINNIINSAAYSTTKLNCLQPIINLDDNTIYDKNSSNIITNINDLTFDTTNKNNYNLIIQYLYKYNDVLYCVFISNQLVSNNIQYHNKIYIMKTTEYYLDDTNKLHMNFENDIKIFDLEKDINDKINTKYIFQLYFYKTNIYIFDFNYNKLYTFDITTYSTQEDETSYNTYSNILTEDYPDIPEPIPNPPILNDFTQKDINISFNTKNNIFISFYYEKQNHKYIKLNNFNLNDNNLITYDILNDDINTNEKTYLIYNENVIYMFINELNNLDFYKLNLLDLNDKDIINNYTNQINNYLIGGYYLTNTEINGILYNSYIDNNIIYYDTYLYIFEFENGTIKINQISTELYNNLYIDKNKASINSQPIENNDIVNKIYLDNTLNKYVRREEKEIVKLTNTENKFNATLLNVNKKTQIKPPYIMPIDDPNIININSTNNNNIHLINIDKNTMYVSYYYNTSLNLYEYNIDEDNNFILNSNSPYSITITLSDNIKLLKIDKLILIYGLNSNNNIIFNTETKEYLTTNFIDNTGITSEDVPSYNFYDTNRYIGNIEKIDDHFILLSACGLPAGVPTKRYIFVYKFNYTIDNINNQIIFNVYEGRYLEIIDFTNINYIKLLININDLKSYVYIHNEHNTMYIINDIDDFNSIITTINNFIPIPNPQDPDYDSNLSFPASQCVLQCNNNLLYILLLCGTSNIINQAFIFIYDNTNNSFIRYRINQNQIYSNQFNHFMYIKNNLIYIFLHIMNSKDFYYLYVIPNNLPHNSIIDNTYSNKFSIENNIYDIDFNYSYICGITSYDDYNYEHPIHVKPLVIYSYLYDTIFNNNYTKLYNNIYIDYEKATIRTSPIDDNDIVNKKYVDNQLSNIESINLNINTNDNDDIY